LPAALTQRVWFRVAPSRTTEIVLQELPPEPQGMPPQAVFAAKQAEVDKGGMRRVWLCLTHATAPAPPRLGEGVGEGGTLGGCEGDGVSHVRGPLVVMRV